MQALNNIIACIKKYIVTSWKLFDMLGMGAQEIILIALVVLLLFGGKKIPELMRGLGRGIREFNDAKDGLKNELKEGMKEKEPQ